MSKLRDNIEFIEGDLTDPPESDLTPYVVFTQLKPGKPHVYAGYLDAADDTMAIVFAREHYGQDQECVSIWVTEVDAIVGTDRPLPDDANVTSDNPHIFDVFVQEKRGMGHVLQGQVEATSPASALATAEQMIDGDGLIWHAYWVIRHDAIISTDDDDLIWRYTDQTYRLARGYADSVRQKWQRIRDERALEEYEKEDLHDVFDIGDRAAAEGDDDGGSTTS